MGVDPKSAPDAWSRFYHYTAAWPSFFTNTGRFPSNSSAEWPGSSGRRGRHEELMLGSVIAHACQANFVAELFGLAA